jgi:hypothetical protein
MSIPSRPVLLVGLLVMGTSCDHPRSHDGVPVRNKPHAGVTEIEPGKVHLTGAIGQTLYVPAYSAIPTADNSQLYQLSVTLSIRNIDRKSPIVVTTVQYFDQDGHPVRNFLKKDLRIAPMAAMDFFVRERDSSGGTAASFLVEWIAEEAVNAPCIETVMVGTTGNQGISFTCPGRVVADRGR